LNRHIELNSVATAGMKPRVILLSPLISQPRYHRRAAMFLEAGYDVRAYAFRRGLYEQNTYPHGVEVVDLGEVQNLKYARRVSRLLRALFIVRRREKNAHAPRLVYAFGLDMAIIACMARIGSCPLVYEVGDVPVPLPHSTLFAKIVGALERFVLQRCAALSVTSLGFLKDYFGIIVPGIEGKTIVVENMIAREVADSFRRPESRKRPTMPLRIGFVGLFRYRESLVALMEAIARRKGDFELHFFGDGPLRGVIQCYAESHENIFNHGSFNSVSDMKTIYEAIDISYAVYDNRCANVRMALPNKLYEAPYFGVPIVVAENTYLSERVRELGYGFVIDPQADGFVDDWLDGLTPEKIESICSKLLGLDSRQMVERYDVIFPKLIELGGLDRLSPPNV
jgi:succinoglycan biosynthesis protein ExoL